jgi:8-oxo-dGTP pyrophosphatase MutT (NUDIX family)
MPPFALPPDEADPWVFHARREVYRNAWIVVAEHEVTRPDGNPGIYGIVSFHNRAVAVVPIDEEECTWLVGQYRPAIGCYSWEVPEGGVLPDEDLVHGAARELREETGLVAGHFQQVGHAFLSNSVCDEEAFAYIATGITFGPDDPDETEQLRVIRLPFDEAVRMVDDGTITDGFSVIALLSADRWRRTHGWPRTGGGGLVR